MATDSTYTISEDDAGQALKVRVRFTDAAGHEETLDSAALLIPEPEESGPSEENEPLAPSRPTGLAASRVAHDAVTLTWDDPGDTSISSYIILRRSVDGHTYGDGQGAAEFLQVGATGGAATTYTDATVESRRKYVYRVKAVNAAGESERSTYLNVETPAGSEPPPDSVDPPAKPTGLHWKSVADGVVVLGWNVPDDDTITHYIILRRDVDGDAYGDNLGAREFVEVGATMGAIITYTDATVETHRRYVYRVKAVNAAGESERSRYANVETPPAPDESTRDVVDPPARPTGLSAAATSGSVTLTWDDPRDASITGYIILRREVDGNTYGDGRGAPEFVEVGSTADAATEYVDTSVSARTKYVYRIVAVNDAGDSDLSSYANAETPA